MREAHSKIFQARIMHIFRVKLFCIRLLAFNLKPEAEHFNLKTCCHHCPKHLPQSALGTSGSNFQNGRKSVAASEVPTQHSQHGFPMYDLIPTVRSFDIDLNQARSFALTNIFLV